MRISHRLSVLITLAIAPSVFAQSLPAVTPVKMVDCTVFGSCSNNTSADPSTDEIYAYAPSIVHVGGEYHAFYCSRGQNTGAYTSNAWDSIRYTHSADGVNWSTPVTELTASASGGKADLSACDPSVVFYKDYFYMFYGSAYVSPAGTTETVIQLARSTSIGGPYLTYTTQKTWVKSPNNPQMIVKPLHNVKNSYGAGQPAVVVYNGKVRMWYTDDTGTGNPATAIRPTYMLDSSDPVTWTPSVSANTNYVGAADVDVKYDSVAKKFYLFNIALNANQTAEDVVVASSTDGLHWTPTASLGLSGFPAPYMANNLGVSGDEQGYIQQGQSFTVSFAGPLDLASTSPIAPWARWNLYGIAGARVGVLPAGNYRLPNGLEYFSNGHGQVCSFWSAQTAAQKASATPLVNLPPQNVDDGPCNGGGVLPAGQYLLPSGLAYFSNGAGDVCSYSSPLPTDLAPGATVIERVPPQNRDDGPCNGGGVLPSGQFYLPNGLSYFANGTGDYCANWTSLSLGDRRQATPITEIPSGNRYDGLCNGGGILPVGAYMLPTGVAYYSNGAGQVCSYGPALSGSISDFIPSIPTQNQYVGPCS